MFGAETDWATETCAIEGVSICRQILCRLFLRCCSPNSFCDASNASKPTVVLSMLPSGWSWWRSELQAQSLHQNIEYLEAGWTRWSMDAGLPEVWAREREGRGGKETKNENEQLSGMGRGNDQEADLLGHQWRSSDRAGRHAFSSSGDPGLWTLQLCWKPRGSRVEKGKRGLECKDVRSEAEKLDLSNHQLKISQPKKSRDRILI